MMGLHRATSPELRTAREWLLGCAAICGLALVAALLLQHVWDMQPCAWCVLQRLIYLLIGVVCLFGGLRHSMAARMTAVVLSLLLSLAGLWAALYQHLVAARTENCGLSFAEKLIMALQLHEIAPWMFVAWAPCDRANLPLLGIPFALWSAALFVLLGLAVSLAGRAMLRSRRGLFG